MINFSEFIKKAINSGLESVEIYRKSSKSTTLSSFNQKIEDCKETLTDVVSIRGVYNNQIGNIYIENLDTFDDEYVINKIKDNAKLITKDEPYFIYKGDANYPKLKEINNNSDKYTLLDKKNLTLKFEEHMRNESNLISNTKVYFVENYTEIAIINSNGLNVSDKSSSAYVSAQVVMVLDDETKNGYDYIKINDFNNVDFSFVKKLVNDVKSTFKATTVKSKTYNVIIENKCFIDILNGYTSIFSANNIIKKVSFLVDKLDQKIFGNNISIYDDPLLEESDFKRTFDDEGVASSKTTLVENGVLKSYLHNLTTAKILNTKSTSNGYKASIASAVNVSISNMYVKPGDKSKDDLIKILNTGLIITSVQGLHAGINSISGDFSLQASGFEVVEGKVVKPVTLIIMSGKLQDMLNNVVELGSDFVCNDQVGAPSVLIKEMNISGN
ncbi:MAG: TldD/PmbA family protein [Anaeroplasmataceae bacterium]